MNPLTYCLNIHPGEHLADVMHALTHEAVAIKADFSPDRPFPLGLRISQTAIQELLTSPLAMQRFFATLSENGFTVMGINGFPYGTFHDTTVKASVYQPDWLDPARTTYTCNLFKFLRELPVDCMGEAPLSVTTVPLAYHQPHPDWAAYAERIIAIAEFLRITVLETGRHMILALEPEPDCVLATSDDIIVFGEYLCNHPSFQLAHLDYLGICVDLCHFAVEYEPPLVALRRIVDYGIPIARIQLSAALQTTPDTEVEDLQPFIDPVYLHQTRLQTDSGVITTYPDLTPELLPTLAHGDARIHYHVPQTWPGTPRLTSTRDLITPQLWQYLRQSNYPLEVELYTFKGLSQELAPRPLVETITEELRWVQEQLRND